MEKRTSAANARCGEVAGYGSVIYGTADAVPFPERVPTPGRKPDVFSIWALDAAEKVAVANSKRPSAALSG